MKITIKKIIRWEQLRGKPFSLFKYEDSDDVCALIYCGSPDTDIDNATYETFKELYDKSPKIMHKQTSGISRYLNYIAQFSVKEGQKEGKENSEPIEVWVRDVAMNLIYSGVDANYVMNDMEMCDLSILGKGCEAAMQSRMEEARVWSYLQSSPYLDRDAVKSPKDYFPFPWEIKGEKNRKERATEEAIRMAEAILGTDGIHLNTENNG